MATRHSEARSNLIHESPVHEQAHRQPPPQFQANGQSQLVRGNAGVLQRDCTNNLDVTVFQTIIQTIQTRLSWAPSTEGSSNHPTTQAQPFAESLELPANDRSRVAVPVAEHESSRILDEPTRPDRVQSLSRTTRDHSSLLAHSATTVTAEGREVARTSELITQEAGVLRPDNSVQHCVTPKDTRNQDLADGKRNSKTRKCWPTRFQEWRLSSRTWKRSHPKWFRAIVALITLVVLGLLGFGIYAKVASHADRGSSGTFTSISNTLSTITADNTPLANATSNTISTNSSTPTNNYACPQGSLLHGRFELSQQLHLRPDSIDLLPLHVRHI